MKNLLENARNFEEQSVKFRMVTNLTVDEVTQFVTNQARWPNQEETKAIRSFGVWGVLEAYRTMKSKEIDAKTILADLEKLERAKLSLWRQIGYLLRSLIEKIFKL